MRATWDETWMAVADAVALRSPCVRSGTGAVIVSPSDRIIATGYNGFPSGIRTRIETTCASICERARKEIPDRDYSDCYAIHAEANALLFCDREARVGGTLYTTTVSCWDCAKLVANSGLSRVVTRVDLETHGYRDPRASIALFRACGLQVIEWAS